MKQTILLLSCVLLSLTATAQRVLTVKAGDAQSLLDAVSKANELNADSASARTYILIPNGFYDLGERVLTQITGHNIAFVGQSTHGTIIRNAPDFKIEGISKTAVFQNRGTGNYFQDLTLKNALDYYSCGAAGRAVTLHDKGTRTICNRVCLLSYQDTYYSDNELAQNFFLDSEIHGTVDFICGAGDVWFERCRIVTEKRHLDGSGRNVIAAPRTSKTQWGYVFDHCTVENIVSVFQYARGWHTTPHCIWLHTTLLSPEKLYKGRFDENGMRTVQSDFKEYGSVDAEGRDVTPKTNVVNFILRGREGNITEQNAVETILTPDEASRYTIDGVYTDWHPMDIIQRTEKAAKKLMKRL